ncbi:MAG: aspartate/glutamate racemase family protein [Deltaproteobacteria bacterium]|nr:aspartate/glutamate racemase family protein [Deltaproteobacteria bacterium]
MISASGVRAARATVGIIMLDTVFPRIPGDIGNTETFPFPVRHQVVRGASPQRVVREADVRLLEPFIEAARSLEREGVRAIATSCGFLAIYQRELADAVKIPVLSSSLLQVRLAHAMINRGQKVGVLTASARSLTERHLTGVGIGDIPLVVMGMDDAEEFTGAFIDGKSSLDPEKVRKEMERAARRLADTHPEIGALVLECTNMPPYAKAVQQILRIPVFDVVTLVRYVHASLERQAFGKAP